MILRIRSLRTLALSLLAVLLSVFLSSSVNAQNCSSPPAGSYSPAWAKQYQKWCESCCGEFKMKGGSQPSCNPTARWGCKSEQPSEQPIVAQPPVDAAAKNREALNRLARNLEELNRIRNNKERAVDRLQNTISTENRKAAFDNLTDSITKSGRESALDRLSKNLETENGTNDLPRSYSIAVCMAAYDTSGSCIGKTQMQTTQILAGMILKQYFKGIEAGYFRVLMPSGAPSIEQIQWLRKMERKAIDDVEAQMLEDIRKGKAFWWETEARKQENLAAIMQDANMACQEADSGINWSHNVQEGAGTSHDFQAGKGLQLLKSIAESGWRGR
jgi:hypothetical protein